MNIIADRPRIACVIGLVALSAMVGGCSHSMLTGMEVTSGASRTADSEPPLSRPQYHLATPGREKAMESSDQPTKNASLQPNLTAGWAAEKQAIADDDTALKRKLVICRGCLPKPSPEQTRETADRTAFPVAGRQ